MISVNMDSIKEDKKWWFIISKYYILMKTRLPMPIVMLSDHSETEKSNPTITA